MREIAASCWRQSFLMISDQRELPTVKPPGRGPARRRLSGKTPLLLLAASLLSAQLWWLRSPGRPPPAQPLAHPAVLCGAGEGRAAAGADAAACPLDYRRHSVEDIEGGEVPYLFGGPQRPCCRNCLNNQLDESGHSWPGFCRYESHGELCAPHLRADLVRGYINRGFTGPLTLSPCDLWPLIAGRSLWFFGDSQTLDFFKAAICFMTEFWDGRQKPVGVTDPEALAALSAKLAPSCVELPAGTRICYGRVDSGGELVQRLLPALPAFMGRRDVAVINFGLHHGGEGEYREALGSFSGYVSAGANRAALPALFWQQTSAQHFAEASGTGEYPGGEPPFQCAPLANVYLQEDGRLALERGAEDPGRLLAGGWRNALADPVMRAAGVPIVQSWNESVPLWNTHRWNAKGLECTHSCHPSAPQTWVYNLFRAMQDSPPA